MRLAVLNRKCGACDVCCKVLAVKEIQKPAGVACAHRRPAGGCGIYETRPESCRIWYCDWVLGRVGTDADRPDVVGGFFWNQSGTGFAHLSPDGGVIVLEANAPGSFTDRAIALAKGIALTRLVYIREGDKDRRMIGPPALLEKVERMRVDMIENR